MSYEATKLAAEPMLIRSRNQSSDIPLRIDTLARDGSLVLVVEGELDISTSHLLDEALTRALSAGALSIVVDLLAVSFIDSTGLHVLIRHAQESRPRIHLTKGSAQVQRVFELTGALDYLPFAPE